MRFADFVKQHAPIKHPEPWWMKDIAQEKRRKTISGFLAGDKVRYWRLKNYPPGESPGEVTRVSGNKVYVKWSYSRRSALCNPADLLREGSIELRKVLAGFKKAA